MRHEPTPAEDLLWQRLRNSQLNGQRFRRQHALGRFIVDFYCKEAGLVIEVDGCIHRKIRDQDADRQEYLESLELRVLRFTNETVLTNVECIARDIAAHCV
jgi:very-short-patch-repair endonuclease